LSANPFLGVFFHWLGGLAAGSFYVPYRGVKKWAWEVYWLVGGVFSWIVAPWILAALNTRDLLGVLGETSASTFGWTWFWGAMWGLGGLTFGLTMRYLGMSLGMAVALGYCAAFGTLMPPIFHGEFTEKVLWTASGRVILLGVAVCLAGIAIAGWAGMSKERETTEDERKATIKEFSFGRGILVATFSGVMSACFAYALDAATPIAEASLARGTPPIWTGLPKLIVVLLGGFTSNFIWCAILNLRNGTARQYFSSTLPARLPRREEETIIETVVDAPSEEVVEHIPWPKRNEVGRVPLAANYFWSALAGVTWYMQFFCYTMGETQMGAYRFSSWTLHMASIIIFSSLWGIFLREWRGASRSTRAKLGLALATLIFSTIVVGYGNYLGTLRPHAS
jgi:L-rhamnose-H+ transport protein